MRPPFASAPVFTLVLAAALAACGSAPATRLHTLLPAGSGAVAPSALPANPAWVLMPVLVPVAVNQPQLVVRLADDTLAALEQDRWAAPLPDELGAAVAQRLAGESTGEAGATPWRIEITVQRFESIVGRSARIEAEWSLAQGAQSALRCRASFEQAVGGGIPALAAGHRAAAAALGDAVAASLRSARGGAPRC